MKFYHRRISKREATKLNIRITAVEEAMESFGTHLRLLNDGASALQNAFSHKAEHLNPPKIPSKAENSNNEIIEAALSARSFFTVKGRQKLSNRLPIEFENQTFSNQLILAQNANPNMYDDWFKMIAANENLYKENLTTNSKPSDTQAINWFRQFVAPYAQGNVVDIGCGTAEKPAYLNDFEHNLITGVDPAAPNAQRNFKFYHGLAETLPWQERSFDNVIVARSISHFLDPKKSLEEIKRILKPSGYVILWVNFNYNTNESSDKILNSEQRNDLPNTNYSKQSFETLLNEQFSITERFAIDSSSTFYAATLKD